MNRIIRNSRDEPVAEIIPNFCKSTLECDSMKLIGELREVYPIRRAGDEIVPGVPQFVDGGHVNLNFRGNPLKRIKAWFQDGPTHERVKIYSYTGFQYGIVAAQFDVNRAPILADILKKYNEWITTLGNDTTTAEHRQQHANHGIITQYETGSDNIGMHYDKAGSLDPNSLITIVKLGPGARPFCITELDGNTVLFDEVVPPGTAIVMTVAQNLKVLHGVPAVDDNGDNVSSTTESSGSVVFRTVVREELVAKTTRKADDTNLKREKRAGARRLTQNTLRDL